MPLAFALGFLLLLGGGVFSASLFGSADGFDLGFRAPLVADAVGLHDLSEGTLKNHMSNSRS